MRNFDNAEFASFVAPAALGAAAQRSFSADVWPWAAGFYGVVNFVLYREILRLLMWMRALNL